MASVKSRLALLPLRSARWSQPLFDRLGFAGEHDRGRDRSGARESHGTIPGCLTAHHLRQRAAVHRQGFQEVHPTLWNDARSHFALLFPVEREDEGVPLLLDDAKRLVEQYVAVYNEKRLHSAIGYFTPQDMMARRQAEIHVARDGKLEQVRERRELAERPELPVLSKPLLSSKKTAA